MQYINSFRAENHFSFVPTHASVRECRHFFPISIAFFRGSDYRFNLTVVLTFISIRCTFSRLFYVNEVIIMLKTQHFAHFFPVQIAQHVKIFFLTFPYPSQHATQEKKVCTLFKNRAISAKTHLNPKAKINLKSALRKKRFL